MTTTTGQHLDSAIMAADRAALIERIEHGDLHRRFGTDALRDIAEHHGPAAARRVVDHTAEQHRDLGLDHDVYRRVAHEALKTTHVIVGDHPPEPRGAPLSEERYTSMQARPSQGRTDDADYLTKLLGQ